jgi:hypothetical protein
VKKKKHEKERGDKVREFERENIKRNWNPLFASGEKNKVF